MERLFVRATCDVRACAGQERKERSGQRRRVALSAGCLSLSCGARHVSSSGCGRDGRERFRSSFIYVAFPVRSLVPVLCFLPRFFGAQALKFTSEDQDGKRES